MWCSTKIHIVYINYNNIYYVEITRLPLSLPLSFSLSIAFERGRRAEGQDKSVRREWQVI